MAFLDDVEAPGAHPGCVTRPRPPSSPDTMPHPIPPQWTTSAGHGETDCGSRDASRFSERIRMTSEPIRDPLTDPLLTAKNAALVVIDYQPSQIQAVRSCEPGR
jgi:hypothetical protein